MADKKKPVTGVKSLINEMPHNYEAEQALLGCIMLDPRVQIELASSLKKEDFFTEAHQNIFAAMEELIRKNQPVDLITLTDALEKEGTLENVGGITYLTGLSDVIPSAANYKKYYAIVTRDSLLRKLILGSADVISTCMQTTDQKEALAFAEKVVYDASESQDTGEYSQINEVLPDVMMQLDELSKNKDGCRGIPTGYRALDHIINGLHRSDLMILAARPSVGKTSFAMNLVENAALAGYSCAIFSLEMNKEQLVQRMLCSVGEVNMANVMRGRMNKSEWLKIAKAKEALSKTKIFINDSSLVTPQEVMSKCRRIKSRYGLDFVVIDYIQLMTPMSNKRDDNRQQQVSEISRYLKIIAKEIDVPVLALSQLSRDVEKRKGRPQLSDLRESGAIEQDADIVMFIHRPDKNATESEIAEGKVEKNVAEILIEKHRNGATGEFKLFFKGECTKFKNIDESGTEVGAKDDSVHNGGELEKIDEQTAPETFDLPPVSDEDLPFDIDEVKSSDDEIFG